MTHVTCRLTAKNRDQLWNLRSAIEYALLSPFTSKRDWCRTVGDVNIKVSKITRPNCAFFRFLPFGCKLYTEWSDVTECMVTIRLPFCGYNTIRCVKLIGEDLSRYLNKTESVILRKCPYDHWIANNPYLSAVTMTNISKSFYLQDGGKKSSGIDMEQNYVTVTLCIGSRIDLFNCNSPIRKYIINKQKA